MGWSGCSLVLVRQWVTWHGVKLVSVQWNAGASFRHFGVGVRGAIAIPLLGTLNAKCPLLDNRPVIGKCLIKYE